MLGTSKKQLLSNEVKKVFPIISRLVDSPPRPFALERIQCSASIRPPNAHPIGIKNKQSTIIRHLVGKLKPAPAHELLDRLVQLDEGPARLNVDASS